jgi:hypothetical protein
MEKEMKKMHSPLTNVVIPAIDSNFTYGRSGYGIEKITIHHCAGIMSAESIGYLWQSPRECSSHYGIGNDGRIGNYVAEENTAWTDSNWVSNCTSITIETSNCDYGGDWPVSDEALNSLINLCADISKRHGLGLLVPGSNLTWHSMYAPTTCPGDYLRARMQYICDRANEIIKGKSHLQYKGHIQNIGWTDWMDSGQLCGTTGQNLRLEGLKIKSDKYDIYAMAHIQDYGWQDYGLVDENTIIGTEYEAKRIECIKLKIVNKENGNIAGRFKIHMQNYGDSPYTMADGVCTLGSVGQALRIEGITIEEI